MLAFQKDSHDGEKGGGGACGAFRERRKGKEKGTEGRGRVRGKGEGEE